VGAILLAALIAVIMGTADSVLLVSSIIIEKDLVTPFLKKNRSDKEKLILTKIITAVTGVAVLGVLYFTTDMFDLWVMSADITGATLAVPILFGFAWKRPGESATIGSIIAGLAGWLVFTIGKFGGLDPIIPGAFCSLTAYLIITFINPAKKGAVKKAAGNA
jgi:Na+/pantothenate symporter